jgi:hypothetical protein
MPSSPRIALACNLEVLAQSEALDLILDLYSPFLSLRDEQDPSARSLFTTTRVLLNIMLLV